MTASPHSLPAALDALPHNGAAITLLATCKRTRRQAYVDIVMVAVVAPLAALVVVFVLGNMTVSF